jgi:hypothetical protein
MMLESPVRGKHARRVWRGPVRKRSSNATFAGWLPYGEAVATIGGVRQTVQVFVMYLCHSRRRYVMAFPRKTARELLLWSRLRVQSPRRRAPLASAMITFPLPST